MITLKMTEARTDLRLPTDHDDPSEPLQLVIQHLQEGLTHISEKGKVLTSQIRVIFTHLHDIDGDSLGIVARLTYPRMEYEHEARYRENFEAQDRQRRLDHYNRLKAEFGP